jgi:hypothetical protein
LLLVWDVKGKEYIINGDIHWGRLHTQTAHSRSC